MVCANFAPPNPLGPRGCVPGKDVWRYFVLCKETSKGTRVYDLASSFGLTIKLAMSLGGFSIKPLLRPPYSADGEEVREKIMDLLSQVLDES